MYLQEAGQLIYPPFLDNLGDKTLKVSHLRFKMCNRLLQCVRIFISDIYLRNDRMGEFSFLANSVVIRT